MRTAARSRRLLAAAAVAAAASTGAWFVVNGPSRVRELPEPRLTAVRQGLDMVRRAVFSRDTAAVPLGGAGALVEWAWCDMAGLSYVDVDLVSTSDLPGPLTAHVVLSAGGVRVDGHRLERSVDLAVRADLGADERLVRAFVLDDGWASRARERSQSFPRFREFTAEAGLGAPCREPPGGGADDGAAGAWPGAGAGVIDLDGDGVDSLFVGDGRASILYRNDGCGRFTDVTEKAGLASPPVPATGVAVADVDGDGLDDLFVTNVLGPARLFRNRGGGTFEDVSARAGLSRVSGGLSAVFADVDGDGALDLFVCGGDRGVWLLRNEGGGAFSDATERFGLGGVRGALAAIFADLDDDGRPDLVLSDPRRTRLYRNVDGRRFADATAAHGLPDRGSVSAAVADFDGEGRLDLHLSGQGNALLKGRAGGRFEDATADAGLGNAGWCWSGLAGDLDNDGRPDLFEVTGHGAARKRYFRNLGNGAFEERGFLDGADFLSDGRAAILADFDGDGSLDVYVRSVGQPEALLLGTRMPGEHFVELLLTEPGLGRAAVGARVTLRLPDGRVQVQERWTASGYLASGSKRLHFGLGPFPSASRLDVRWPDGACETFSLPSRLDGVFLVERGASAARRIR